MIHIDPYWKTSDGRWPLMSQNAKLCTLDLEMPTTPTLWTGIYVDEVTEHKDLGIIISSLKAADHCHYACAELAIKMLWIDQTYNQTQRYDRNGAALQEPSQTHLEYCSAWSPHYSKDKVMLEKVQYRFTRLFPELRDMRYEDRLDVLHIWSLKERRNRADLIELFKMIHGFTDASLSAVLQSTTDSSTRGHDKKLMKSHCHTDSRLYFFPRVINRGTAWHKQW